MSNEPVTDLDHARYDRDGWMETALAAQRRIAELDRAAGGFLEDRDVAWLRIKDLEAEIARLRQERDSLRSYADNLEHLANSRLLAQSGEL